MKLGTRVENQADPRIGGTIVAVEVPGLPGFVTVEWDDGQTFDEQVEDVTRETVT